MAGATSVGGIEGFLRLDADQFHREIAQALAEVEALTGKKVDVDFDTDGVHEYTAATYQATRAVGEESDAHQRAAKSADQHRSRIGALGTSIIALGPAIVPLAAGAVGLGAAFAGMGVAGVFAIAGIKQEMAEGTQVGQAYSASLGVLKGDFSTLSRVAATGVLAPFQKVVSDLHQQMPQLTSDISDFAGMLGNTAIASVQAMLNGWRALQPLLDAGGVTLTRLATAADGFSQSQGFASFVSYATASLPQVVGLVRELVPAVVSLIGAFAPMGSTVVSVLTALSSAINALPMGALQTLATVGTAVFLSFKTWSLLSGIVSSLGSSLESLGGRLGVARAEAIATSGAFSVMSIAAAGVSVALGIAVAAWTIHQQKVLANQQVVDGFTQSLIASHGAIDQSVRDSVSKQLADQGLLNQAKQLGISLPQLTSAVLGQGDAYQQVTSQLDGLNQGQQTWVDSYGVMHSSVSQGSADAAKFKSALAQLHGQFSQGVQAQQDYAAATDSGTGSTNSYEAAIEQVRLAHLSSATATASDTTALQALNAEVDKALGKALSLAQSQTAVDQATLNATEALKANKGTMSQHTKAGVADRQAIENAVGALQQQRKSLIDNGASQASATSKYQAGSRALLDQIGKLDGTKSAAYKYAAQLLRTPKAIRTSIGLNGVQAAEDAIQHIVRPRTVQVNVVVNGTVVGHVANNAARAKASEISSIRNAYGSLTLANGVRKMADGDLLGGRQASVMRSTAPILWNEAPGGEAYIPLAPDKRARSTQILAGVAEEFGLQVSAKVGRGDGPLDLSDATIARLVAAMSRVQLATSVSIGAWDRQAGRAR